MNSTSAPVPPVLSNNYNRGSTTSQVEMTGPSGQTYSGQITTRPTQQGSVPSGALAGALAGYQDMAAIAQYQQAANTRSDLFNSCMYRRGWELQQR